MQSRAARWECAICNLFWPPPHEWTRQIDTKQETTKGDTSMRFMVMVKATKDSEAGKLPGTELLTEMGKFNDELVKAGVMLAGEGLQPSSKGARVKFAGKNRTVMDGPFAETKELVAG